MSEITSFMMLSFDMTVYASMLMFLTAPNGEAVYIPSPRGWFYSSELEHGVSGGGLRIVMILPYMFFRSCV